MECIVIPGRGAAANPGSILRGRLEYGFPVRPSGPPRNDRGGEGGNAMKIGVLQFFSWPERRVDLATVFARALQRIEIMDRTGYDAVWLAEHHFSDFSVCPSIHMVGTLVAARTTRLRIGTGVSLAPFYHPLR